MNKINFEQHVHGHGIQAKLKFSNGYGVSIIQNEYSYGGTEGQFELALTNSKGEVIYDDDLFTDVIGYLEEDEIDSLIEYIKTKNPIL